MLKYVLFIMTLAVGLTACSIPEQAPADTTRTSQADKAQAAANALDFATNAEIDNITKRLKLTSQPGLLGYVLLFNPGSGNPAVYATVKGKITSGGKRLQPTDRITDECDSGNGYRASCVRAAPGDEGTYGTSGEYIYFWTESGQYIQWNGNYLYSDKPIRVPANSLLVNLVDGPNHAK